MQKYKLSELYNISSGLSKSAKDFGFGNPFLSFTTVFNNFHIPDSLENLVNTTPIETERFSVKRGDVFVTRTSEKLDELGKSCVALKDYEKATFNGFCKRLRPIHKEDIILPEYAQYLFRSSNFTNQIIHSCPMSTRASLNEEILNTVQLNVHNLSDQQHIVDIIGSIDDKIENNNKLINKLIQYKHLDYQSFINCNITKRIPILELVDFIGGTQPPKSEHIYEEKNGYVRFVQNRDYSTNNHITYIKVSKKNKICDEYDIMMDKYGEAGKVRFGISGAYNVALAKIKPKKSNLQELVREYFSDSKTEQYLANSSIASTRASVSEENLNNLFIDYPNNIELLEEFEKKHKLYINYILKINKENELLLKIKNNYLNKFFN